MLSRRKLSEKERRLRKAAMIVLSFALALLCFFEFSVKHQMTSVIREQLETDSVSAINAAVKQYLTAHPDLGENLIMLHQNENGDVKAISSDPARINEVKTDVTLLAQENIIRLCKKNGVTIPLGALSGLVFLSELGPSITLHIESKQTVHCEFESAFEGVGINQTLHHIRLIVYSEITVYNPFPLEKPVSAKTAFEIAQTVIVGAVPSYGGVVTY